MIIATRRGKKEKKCRQQKCGDGEGDCNRDSDCQKGLVCHFRSDHSTLKGYDFSNIYGGTDVCVPKKKDTNRYCEKPFAFCSEYGDTYTYEDCDGDGIKDHVCRKRGRTQILRSTNMCKNTDPDGWCTNKEGPIPKLKKVDTNGKRCLNVVRPGKQYGTNLMNCVRLALQDKCGAGGKIIIRENGNGYFDNDCWCPTDNCEEFEETGNVWPKGDYHIVLINGAKLPDKKASSEVDEAVGTLLGEESQSYLFFGFVLAASGAIGYAYAQHKNSQKQVSGNLKYSTMNL